MKKKKPRSKEQMRMDILDCCLNPINRTNISFAVRQQYTPFMKDLSTLIELGLIKSSEYPFIWNSQFLITAKGREILKKYKGIIKELTELKEYLEF